MIVRRHRLLASVVPLVGMAVTSDEAFAFLCGPTTPTTFPSRIKPPCKTPSASFAFYLGVFKRKDGQASPDDDSESDDKRVSKTTGEILAAVNSVLPFNKDETAAKSKKNPEKKEVEGGFFGQVFRRKSESVDVNTSKKNKSSKSTESRSPFSIFGIGESKDVEPGKKKEKIAPSKPKKPSKPKTEGKAASSRSDDDSGSSNSNSALQQIQGFLPFKSSPSDKQKELKKSNESSSSSNNNNPLSAIIPKLFFPRNNDPFAKNAQKEDWYPVFPKTRIMPGEIKPVTVKGLDLLVIASTDNRSLYCIANSCPHLGTPLETGRLTRLPTEVKTATTTITEQPIAGCNKPDLMTGMLKLSETDVSNILSQDGCEDCIVCPLHHTAFALQSGEVRGEWCPYPPVLGKLLGTIKPRTSAAVFDVRTRGKNVEVRLNSVLLDSDVVIASTTDPNKADSKTI